MFSHSWCKSVLSIAYLLSLSSSQNAIDLSGDHWTLQNVPLNISVPASLPSYAHLDLEANNVTSPLEYGLNDFNLRWVWKANWTYIAPISGLQKDSEKTFLLFNGLDTFADIELCGQHVASTDNQFRQYHFDVSHILPTCKKANDPVLSINFGSAPKIAADISNKPGQEKWPDGVGGTNEIPNKEYIRKQQNDFGWDWGPAYAPAGPWMPAYAIQLQKNEIHARNALVDVYRAGQRNNLIPDQSQPWVVNASIDFLGSLPKGASFSYTLKDTENKTISSGPLENVNQTDGAISGMTTIKDSSVDLWWPVGMGKQALYHLTLDIKGRDGKTISSVDRRIGFRTIVMNALPISDEQLSMGIAPGNNWHFEINGHEFYAKGSNFIPPDIFWARMTKDRMKTLFDNVVAGNQNMLRVWSSGAYSPDYMFDLADEMGILLWTEFEFSDSLYPVDDAFLSNVWEEAVYQVRRVNYHPSLSYWAGGNELENLELPSANRSDPSAFPRLRAEYEKLFLSTLFRALFENSRSISYSPSSTSNGWISLNFTDPPYMQERYEELKPGSIYGETDYYNYDSSVAFDYSGYPVGRFSNEFGFHSMPSVQTWQEYVPEEDLWFNSTTILLRNRHYPPGGLYTNVTDNTLKGMGEMTMAVERWYPVPSKTDRLANFSSWCWTTQIFQAEFYGAQIQFYRRGSGLPERQLGSLYWQLEDQWAAPTWAGIDRGGRWKVLHYRARDLYSNVIVSPFFNETTKDFEIWVTSDLWDSVEGKIDTKWYSYDGSSLTGPKELSGQKFKVGALNSTRVYISNLGDDLGSDIDPANAVMRMNITVNGQAINSQTPQTFTHTNWFHASRLSEAKLADPGLTISHDAESQKFTVKATKGVSAWTWLDYPAGGTVVFEDNGFWLAKGESRELGYTVTTSGDLGDDDWIGKVTVQSLWNNTVKD